ncbi:MAG: undecaprenyldiphospho-muramoylpentapeptide beta-N-acetylglucosaminyltransferase [Deltaproteobacteria bacterium]|nr:undecaprenyldiphospho-muramoylpentapeptide beta-N-acetylglucosaminyltransferase [Deltaproteobacteria bacterium]
MSGARDIRGMRVIVAGAQTGGHLYPAVAVGRRLAAAGAEVTLVASGAPAEQAVLRDAGLRIEVLKVGKLKGMGLSARLRGMAGLPGGLLRARAMVRKLDPAVALGFGGYTTGPLLLMASLAGVPVVVCEQNSIPGFTNRVLARFARRVLVAFDETQSLIGAGGAVRTGNPVRPEVLAVPAKRYGGAARRVLVFGGSQGSGFLNERMPPVLAEVARRLPGLEVTHQTGTGRDAPVRAAYEAAGVRADVREYLHGMADAYAAADFVACRAGAGTVFEVTAIGIPALFVPFAAAADDHQTANARPVVAPGGALSVAERDFDTARVADWLAGLLADPGRMQAMADASRGWGVRDALDRIADEVAAIGTGVGA